MNILHASIDRPRAVIALTLLILAGALFAFIDIPVQRAPAIYTAVAIVAVPYPGANPTEVENEITRKIEEKLRKLDRVDWMQSASERGACVITVVFLDGVAPKQARADVEHLVNEVRHELPLGRDVQPLIQTIDFENTPIMRVAIAGPPGFDARTLKTVAEEVQDELESISGVSSTDLFGGHEREIHINYHPNLLHQYGLTLTDLRSAVGSANLVAPGGTLETEQRRLQVRNESKFATIAEIRRVVIKETDDRVVRVEDVAEVVDSYQRPRSASQLDGQASATILVQKETGINTLGVCEQIKQTVEELRQKYPHIAINLTGDASREIQYMFTVLGSSAVYGGILVLLILNLSMGFRIATLVVMAIPFSTAVALVLLYALEIPLSNMAIFSYILVLGIVVDGAIIVAENIHRHLEMGKSANQAAKDGIDEVALPVFAADLTTVAAFLPMFLIPGIMGDFLSVMPQVVGLALIGSMFVDHFLIPVVTSLWFGNPTTETDHPIPSQPAPEPTGILSWPGRVLTAIYLASLRYSLRNRYLILTVCGCAIAWSGLMLWSGAIKTDFFPASDRGQFTITFELPLGHSLEETQLAANHLVKDILDLRENNELRHFITALGSSGAVSNPMEGDSASGPEFGRIMVELTSPTVRQRHQDVIIQELRQKFDSHPWPGMKYSLKAVQEGPPGGAEVAIRLLGDNLDQLGNLADEIMDELRKIPGTVDVRTNYRPANPELRIDPDPQILGLLGMNGQQFFGAIATAVQGDNSLEMVIDDKEVPIRIQALPEYQRYPNDIRRLMISTPEGRIVTVGEVAEITQDQGLYNITRRNGTRMVTVACDLVKPEVDPEIGKTAEEVFDRLREVFPEAFGFKPSGGIDQQGELIGQLGFTGTQAAMRFLGQSGTVASGVRAEFTGENEETQKNFAYLSTVMVLAILLIATILVIQFNSFRQTLVVLLTIPLSFVGVIFGMWLCDFAFSLSTFIGLVSLTGIVVNDAIVMIDFVNNHRRESPDLFTALVDAGRNRLRPVVLTTTTTIGGLLPLLLNLSGGAEFWQPLTAAIIFGLGIASVLTLIVIPVFYSLSYQPWQHQPTDP